MHKSPNVHKIQSPKKNARNSREMPKSLNTQGNVEGGVENVCKSESKQMKSNTVIPPNANSIGSTVEEQM